MTHIDEHQSKVQSVWERVHLAGRSLANGVDIIQIRLGGAYMNLSPLLVNDFPEEHQPIFSGIIADLQEHLVQDRLSFIRVDVTDDEGSQIAGRIFDFYRKIERLKIERP